MTTGTTRVSPGGRTGRNGPASVTLPATSFVPGDVIILTGDGWLPGSVVNVFLFSTPVLLGTAEVDADGNVAARVRIPLDTEPGAHELIMTGLDEDGLPRTVTIPITILASVTDASAGDAPTREITTAGSPDRLAAVAQPDHPLAQTGGGVTTLAVRGVLLLLAGLAALRASGRRRDWLRAG